MANFKVVEEAYVKQESVLYQGEVEFEGNQLLYRYFEDNNGQDYYVFVEGEGWVSEHPFIPILMACIGEWGSPVEFGKSGEDIDIDDVIVEDYE
jgi:hypothetical protein